MITIITWRSDHIERATTKYFRLVVKADGTTPAGVEVRDTDVLGAERWNRASNIGTEQILSVCIACDGAGRVLRRPISDGVREIGFGHYDPSQKVRP